MSARPPYLSPFAPHTRRIGLLSTYPPKLCGLATFAAALENELRRSGHVVDIVRIDDGSETAPSGRTVAASLENGVPGSIRNAAAVLSRTDIAIIQHEYGIYGGTDGDEVLDLLDALDVPTIVVLHTVPLHPSANQRSILASISDRADQLVVMSETAKDRLLSRYPVDGRKVSVIPHGASMPTAVHHDGDLLDGPRPQLLTWGLLGPGKGIEHTIDALALLEDLRPRPRYTVAGVTHPKVLAREGDEYRQSLIRQSWEACEGQGAPSISTMGTESQLSSFPVAANPPLLTI